MATVRFDRGTLVLEGEGAEAMPCAVWDARVSAWRAPARRYDRVRRAAEEAKLPLEDAVAARIEEPLAGFARPALRPYQDEALRSWQAIGSRGVIVLPTGAGKTIVAVAAMADARVPCLVLCPTRALLEQWEAVLARWYSGRIGVVGDGVHRVAEVTVMTFQSAYRRMDVLGDRYGLLVVDEVHHFASGMFAEALEMCVAARRLGLTATAPDRGSAGEVRLSELVGPLACEVGVAELLGVHLADLEIVRILVRLTRAEAAEYGRLYRPFSALRAAFFHLYPTEDWAAFLRALSRSEEGRRAVKGYRRAVALASFPSAKRELVGQLLARHRDEKMLLFTGGTEDAYEIAREHLVPVITAETGRKERRELLDGFREGRYRALVAAQVLNEGIDVPDARVGVVVAGRLGEREHVQRVGRVLRPSPGKRALVYELVTTETMDDARARARGRRLVAGEAARP